MKRYTLFITAALLAAVVWVGTACTKKPAVDAVETGTTQTTEKDTQAQATKPSETQAPTEESTGEEPKGSENYHMLQGAITKATEDGTMFTLQADDGRSHDINASDIRDVETEIKEGAQIAIAYIGPELGELKDVTLVVALPEQEEWSILTETGTTTSNAMSSFNMKTEDGRELGFIKDNCPIEEGVMGADSGEKVAVTYVNSQGTNFPLEIKAAE